MTINGTQIFSISSKFFIIFEHWVNPSQAGILNQQVSSTMGQDFFRGSKWSAKLLLYGIYVRVSTPQIPTTKPI